MQYVNLGKTGLQVSRICLGCMTYGIPDRGNHLWTLNEPESRPFIQRALELGINFFDTANVYSDGTSEEIVGRALRDFAVREDVVIATKVHGRMRPGPNGAGLSRNAILTEIDASLRRLGTDYVDLYQIHRWDNDTPLEETLEALHDVVKAGKARYLGASSMYAWQFCKALQVAKQNGWTQFVSMQDHYNLLNREEEREMLGLLRVGRHRRSALESAGARQAHPPLGGSKHPARGNRRVWQNAVPGRGRIGSSNIRQSRRNCGRAWCSEGADRPGLAAVQTRRHRADCRSLQAAPSGRCRRRAECPAFS